MLNRSDVVQVPFPFSDLSRQKRRPVLLLTPPDGFGDFLAVAVTSQPGHADAVPLENTDIVAGSLPKTSWVRSSKLFSLNQANVIVTLGSLKPEAFTRILGQVCTQIGCRPAG
ncbi:MAG: type II toxin-antitoxin system PemK/MazF family toxin [Rhodocyclaceae bacterium]|nr:type II toxin-antitoxin system PemK/MazF family toxin [Rhodocyclaceae bacterium]